MNNLLTRIARRIDFYMLRSRIPGFRSGQVPIEIPRRRQLLGVPDLQKDYETYVSTVSSPQMAASFECISFLIAICKMNSFAKVLDIGSGFSSFALRHSLSEAKANVWSVDDHDAWLKKTITFLLSRQVTPGNFLNLDDFIASAESNFDMIFLDLNFVEVRKHFIELAVQRCKQGGVIVFDDVHKDEYLYEVLRQGQKLGLRFFDVKELTMDAFGRFALLGIKKA